MMSVLYDVEIPTINEHIAKIYADNELGADSTIRNFLIVQIDILKRANHTKNHMGLTSWEAAPDGKIQKFDVSIAKNYLAEAELDSLQRVVTMYLDYAELQATRNIPMTMEDWKKRLDAFLQFTEYEILHDSGKY
jgi:hypothetical protein